MADWKAQVTYNYNPSYHTYAYGLVYQPAPEQNHGNPTGWAEATDLSNYNGGVTQAYYATTARAREEPQLHIPEQHAVNGHGHYQGSGVVYLGETQTGRVLLTGSHLTAYDPRTNEIRQAEGESTSDSEVHTSPSKYFS